MLQNLVGEIPELNQPHVHIKNPEMLNKKLNGILKDGFQQLQIVSDFDLTITKQHLNGERHLSSFRMFGACPSLTTEYKETSKGLVTKYYPLEYDPKICYDDKRKLMEEWWMQSERALKGLTVTPKEIDEVVSNLNTALRDGTDSLFKKLLDQNIPVLVFSAGLGDTVVALLKHYGVLYPNIQVISNFLNYDKDGIIMGFKGPLIHVLNKNEFAIKHSDYYDLVKDRSNVILLGDSLGDANMADGIEHAQHILKIGFIYEKVEGNLPSYLDTFDVVLEDDQTMDVVHAIISKLKMS